MLIYINPKDQDDSEVVSMTVSYKKLWKLLIDRDLKKKDLETMAQVSHYTCLLYTSVLANRPAARRKMRIARRPGMKAIRRYGLP